MEEFMGLLRKSPLVVALAIGGCTYVTPADFEEKVACLDEDGDGVVAKDECVDLPAGDEADCDDSRADRFPGNTEVPYDGIDQDCSRADLVDVDGDLFPGILEADWVAQHGEISWPTNLQASLDCNDTVNTTFPGSQAEVPYDGVDANCDAKDDWDFDGDGHVPPDSLHNGVPYTGSLPQDDCDDTRADVNPASTTTDQPYDGIDHDCDGANDFDKDGDGYIQDSRVAAYLAFLALYEYPDDRPCTATDGSCNDCDDDPANDGAQPRPAGQINPGATETYYDGLDQNCDGLDDFDQDLDTFACDGSVDSACTGHSGTDCDDGEASINPSELELLGDTVDQDCSGDEDAPRFNFGNLEWLDPSTPDIARTDTHYVIAASASSFDGGTGAIGPAASAITLRETDADGSGRVDKIVPLEPLSVSDLQPVGRAIAMLGEPTVFSFALSVFDRGADERTRLRVRQFQWLSSSSIYFERLPTSQIDAIITSGGTLPDPDPYLDFDIVKASDGGVWGVGCSLETVHFTIAKPNGATMFPARGAYASTLAGSAISGGGSVCWVDVTSATAGLLHAYEGSTYRRFALDGTTSSEDVAEVGSPTHPTSAFNPLDVRHRGRYVVFARGATSISVFDTSDNSIDTITTPENALSADIAVSGSTFFIAAVVEDMGSDGVNDVILYEGTNLASMGAPHEMRFTDPNDSEPTGVAIYAESTSLVLLSVSGVSSGSADAVGWAFLGFAP